MSRLSHLKDELKVSRPFRTEGQEAVLSMLRTTSLIKRRLAVVAQREGITAQQYNVLRILRGSSEPLPVMEIANRMIEVEPGITRLMRRLEKKDLVIRERSTEDARRVLCTISGTGLGVLERLEDQIIEFEYRALGELTTDELNQMIYLLAKSRATMSD